MKKLYSIGETAKIMGISVQTLRNYANTSLLKPAYINEETGYRYFSFEEFHIIDRIRYLRGFGLSLNAIESIVEEGNIDVMIDELERREKEVEQEMKHLMEMKEDIQWYIEYFKYHNQSNVFTLPRVEFFKERYVMYTSCTPGESIEDIEVRLAKEKTDMLQYGYQFHRQFGYVLDYRKLVNREWSPSQYYIFLKKKPKQELENVRTLPEGYYLCMKFRLHHLEELNTSILNEYFMRRQVPKLVFANEYEDNLVSYSYCPYELQVYLE